MGHVLAGDLGIIKVRGEYLRVLFLQDHPLESKIVLIVKLITKYVIRQ